MAAMRQWKREGDKHEIQPWRPVHCRSDLPVENSSDEQQRGQGYKKMPSPKPHRFGAAHSAGERGGGWTIDWIKPDSAPVQPQQKPGNVQDEINEVEQHERQM